MSIQIKKLKSSNSKKIIPARFDKEGFFLSFGLGLASFGIGLLIVWGTLTAPEGTSNSTGFTLYQRLARQIPESFQEKIALVLGGLFMLFGLVLFLLGIKQTVQFLFSKIFKANN
ncbi:MAG: hypothetical protein WCZ90_09870 [Melioribacteraceae bacterium]